MAPSEILRDLVRIPSLNPMGRTWPAEDLLYEHRVTDYLERFATRLGLPCERQAIAPKRENLVVRYTSPGARRTILFEVHQDTVPVEGMTIDPFGGEIRDGKLYGRGACDVKGSMAAMLAVLQRLVRERPAGAANLTVAFTADEEHTFLGVQQLVKSGIAADFAVVAEPTGLGIVDAHKGVVRWKVTAPGRACHSSRPEQGTNAIYRMGKLLTVIEEYAEKLRASRNDPRLGAPTLSVGRIEGGTSVNTVPDFCTIEIDRRLLPGESADAAVADFEMYVRTRADFEFERHPIWLSCPALNPERGDEVRHALGTAIESVLGAMRLFAVPFGTDASTIVEAGIPAVVFGPGDIAQAHTKDEWIDLAEVDLAAEILYRLILGGP